MLSLLLFVIALALIFDFINGFHDAANSIATVVSTRVLTPFLAVIWAAFFNAVVLFLCQHGLFGFEFHIADTVAKIVRTESIDLIVIMSGLLAAIAWNLITWWYGIPSSSSHTLMGGFAGAAIAKSGFSALADLSKIYTTLAFIVLAPLIGLFFAYLITVAIIHLCKKINPTKANLWFRRLQLLSSAAFSLGHGSNDAQKVMGIISAALLVYAHANPEGIPLWLLVSNIPGKALQVPLWVQYACFLAIGLGTLCGGWRIIKTMGSKITKVTPLEGVSAETAGAITLYLTQFLGIPVSTTHTITGAIIGVGLTKRVSAVRWGITINIFWAWVLTIPVSGLLAALLYFISAKIF